MTRNWKLKYVGNRKRDITVQGPVTGNAYYLSIEAGEIEVDPKDAEAMLADGDLWVRAETPAARPSEKASE